MEFLPITDFLSLRKEIYDTRTAHVQDKISMGSSCQVANYTPKLKKRTALATQQNGCSYFI